MMSGTKSLNLVDLPRSFPEVCLLSNGRYSVMLTASGGGYSALKGMDVTRAGGKTLPATAGASTAASVIWTMVASGPWAANHLGETPPTMRRFCAPIGQQSASRRQGGDMLRGGGLVRCRCGSSPRYPDQQQRPGMQAGGYELCGNSSQSAPRRPGAPCLRQAFPRDRIPCGVGSVALPRRPRTHDQPPIWALHTLASKVAHEVEYETDRARFLGRGRSTRNPAGLDIGAVLRERWDRCWTLCLACASVFRLSLERRRPWRSQPPRRKIGVRP
jgi:hypothetical protein